MIGNSTIGDRAIAVRHARISSYLVRDFKFQNEESKVPCRRRVAAHLLQHNSGSVPKLFSLPGPHWQFERLVLAAMGANCTCVAIEREIGVIRRFQDWVPGRNTRWFEQQIKDGQIEGIETSRAKVLFLDFSRLMRMGRLELGANYAQKWWVRNVKGWTMAWLDFMCPIGPDLEHDLFRLGGFLSDRISSAPIAITVLKGREAPDVTERISSVGGREEYIRWILSRGRYWDFSIDDSFEYRSASGATMLTVLLRTSHKTFQIGGVA